jgi:hypothetical protein
MQGSGGAKAPCLVSHEAKIACPNCSFEGLLEEYDVLEPSFNTTKAEKQRPAFYYDFYFGSLLRLLSLFSLY